MKKLSLLSLFVFAFAVFGEPEEYINAANILAENGYIVDQSKDIRKYNLSKTILRQEAIGIITKVNGLVGSGDSGYICQNKFLDVSNKDGWVCYVAESAASSGVVNPNNTRFRPKDNMTRYEAMILAFKGSCLQPIDSENTDSPQDQVKNFAMNTGVISTPSIEMNVSVTRGEFFTYITRAQNYKEANVTAIDPNLPGCTPFQEVNFGNISVKIPANMQKAEGNPEVPYEQSYNDYNSYMNVSLGIYDAEGKTDISVIMQEVKVNRERDLKNYKLLQDYAWKGGRITTYSWQEELPVVGLTKVYDYSLIKNGMVYSVIIALPIAQDVSTNSIRNAILNSVRIK